MIAHLTKFLPGTSFPRSKTVLKLYASSKTLSYHCQAM